MTTREFHPSQALLKVRLGLSLIPALIPAIVVCAVFANSGRNAFAGFAAGFVPIATILFL